jgi:hypothetical protein
MTPAELRHLIAAAEHHPGETNEQFCARCAAEHQLSSWRVWLPGLLARIEGLERATRTYADSYMLDEASDPDLTGIDVTQHKRAVAVFDALDDLLPITPASQASGGAPAAVRSLPAGAHNSEVSQ